MGATRVERAPQAIRTAEQQDFLIRDFHGPHFTRSKLSGSRNERGSHILIFVRLLTGGRTEEERGRVPGSVRNFFSPAHRADKYRPGGYATISAMIAVESSHGPGLQSADSRRPMVSNAPEPDGRRP